MVKVIFSLFLVKERDVLGATSGQRGPPASSRRWDILGFFSKL